MKIVFTVVQLLYLMTRFVLLLLIFYCVLHSGQT